MSIRRRTRLGLTGLLSLALSVLMLSVVGPANATNWNHTWLNPNGTTGGQDSYSETLLTRDAKLLVTDWGTGYHETLKMQALVNGTWYTYLSTLLSDGHDGVWNVSNMPKGQIRLVICPLDSNYNRVGSCITHFGYKSV